MESIKQNEATPADIQHLEDAISNEMLGLTVMRPFSEADASCPSTSSSVAFSRPITRVKSSSCPAWGFPQLPERLFTATQKRLAWDSSHLIRRASLFFVFLLPSVLGVLVCVFVYVAARRNQALSVFFFFFPLTSSIFLALLYLLAQ